MPPVFEVLRAAVRSAYSLEDVFIAVVEKAREQGKVAKEELNSMRTRLFAQARKELTRSCGTACALALALVSSLGLLMLMGSRSRSP